MWVRHMWECFVGTQRTDRTGINRDELPQSAPVNFMGEMNIQNAIDTSRKRLCYQASNETREYCEDLKLTLHEHPELHYAADVLVPNCIYRCGCPELQGCGFYQKLVDETGGVVCSTNIQERYNAYNEWFYKKKAQNKASEGGVDD